VGLNVQLPMNLARTDIPIRASPGSIPMNNDMNRVFTPLKSTSFWVMGAPCGGFRGHQL
jgi:hypothetical protein